MLTWAGIERAPLGYRSAALLVELSSPQGSEMSFIQLKGTKYSHKNLTLIHERMDSIAQQVERRTGIPNVRVQIPPESTFFSWLWQCQIVMKIFCSYSKRLPYSFTLFNTISRVYHLATLALSLCMNTSNKGGASDGHASISSVRLFFMNVPQFFFYPRSNNFQNLGKSAAKCTRRSKTKGLDDSSFSTSHRSKQMPQHVLQLGFTRACYASSQLLLFIFASR